MLSKIFYRASKSTEFRFSWLYFGGPFKKITFIIGVFADKEYNKIIDTIIEFADKIFTVETPDNPRALSSKALAEFVKNNYDVDVSYKKKDYYKVILKNTSNDHTQVILKNNIKK